MVNQPRSWPAARNPRPYRSMSQSAQPARPARPVDRKRKSSNFRSGKNNRFLLGSSVQESLIKVPLPRLHNATGKLCKLPFIIDIVRTPLCFQLRFPRTTTFSTFSSNKRIRYQHQLSSLQNERTLNNPCGTTLVAQLNRT